MLKSLACLFVIAAVAAVSNAAVKNAGSNTGMNVMSSNSQVVQSGVQNVNDADYGYGYGRGYYGGLDYLGHHGYGGYHPGLYGYGAPAYGYHGGYGGYGGYGGHGYGLGGAGYGYPSLHGYPGGYGYALDSNVNSKSTNTAMNVMSKNSDVVQHNVQNANKMKY